MVFCVFFFFQAEDGIRDIGVTGVQTCALPISSNVIFLIIITAVVMFSWIFFEFSSLIQDIRGLGFPLALQYSLTVCCSSTVRDWGERMTRGGEIDSPGVPFAPGTPGVPGGPSGPFGPGGPATPGGPIIPCGPRTPGGPFFP